MNFFRKSKFKSLFALAFYYFLAFLFGPKLSGQTYTPFLVELESIKEKANWALGPFWIDPGLQLNLTFDNNIYGSYGRQKPVADYVTSIAVPFNIYLPFRDRLVLSLVEKPQFVQFLKLKNENSFNNSYSAGARLLLLNSLVLSGSHKFDRTKQRISSEIDSRVFQQIEGSNASLFLETEKGSAIGIVGSTDRYTYEDETLPGQAIPLSTSLNRKENNIRLEIYRPVFTESTSFLSFGYAEYAFADPQSRNRDSDSYQASAGIAFPLLGSARGLLSLGYKNFRPRKPGLTGYSGPIGNTSLDFRFTRLGVRFLLLRDVLFSYLENSIFYIDSRLGAGLSFYLTRNIRLDYDFYLGEGEYQEIQRKDKYLGHSGSFVFRIVGNTGIGFRVSYGKRDSNNPLYNTDRGMAEIFIIDAF